MNMKHQISNEHLISSGNQMGVGERGGEGGESVENIAEN